MKLRSFLTGLASLALLASCSDDREPAPAEPTTPAGDRFLVVKIINPVDSRAGEEFEYGSEAEGKIKLLRFYFFKADGSASMVGNGGNVNYVDINGFTQTGNDEKPDGNIESTTTVDVPLYSVEGKKHDDVSSIIVVANPGAAKLDNATISLDALRGKIADYSFTETVTPTAGNFVMTNSVYVDENEVKCAVPVTDANIKETISNNENAATATPVSVYLERVVAKVRTQFDWTDKTIVATEATLNGTSVNAYPIKNRAGEAVKADKNTPVYVVFNGWNITNTADRSYLIKNLPAAATSWSFGTGPDAWAWNNPINWRSHWAINPTDVNIAYNKSFNDLTNAIGKDNVVYTQENAGNVEATGEKTSKSATALFGATLVTIADGVATPVTLARFNDKYLTQESTFNYYLNDLLTGENTIWYKTSSSTDPEGNNFSNNITKYLKFGEVDGKVCVQLDDTKELPQFYKNITSSTTDENLKDLKIDMTEVNKLLAGFTPNGIEVAYDGRTIYEWDIRHLGIETTTGAGEEEEKHNFGKYGIVRNHIYDIKINAVYGPGNFVFNPTEVFVPTLKHTFQLAATVNVLSWRVVNNNATLEWQ